MNRFDKIIVSMMHDSRFVLEVKKRSGTWEERAAAKMLLAMDKSEKDGGAGSGNFGHKGRPGLRGGSGKGGSAAYAGVGGSLRDGNGTADYTNTHVPQQQRDDFKAFAKQAQRSIWNAYDKNKAYKAQGMGIRDEIESRVKLRKKAKDLDEWNTTGEMQTEDIYDTLRDIRSFGATTEEAQAHIGRIESELPQDRTDAIVKEALDSVPTDWLEQAEFPVNIRIVDAPGRANYIWNGQFHDGGYITVFAKENPRVVKDLGLENDNITDMGIANQLRHELGHYIEESNYSIGQRCREYLAERTKDSESEYNYNGEEIKRDKFFSSYMGRQYPNGATEILSVCLQNLGCANPKSGMTNGMFVDERDTNSFKFALGLLAYANGGYHE